MLALCDKQIRNLHIYLAMFNTLSL